MGLYSIPLLHLPQSKPHTVKIQAQISMNQPPGHSVQIFLRDKPTNANVILM